MKVKTAKGLFKEGLQNMIRNRAVSVISISTVFLSLTIFSIFFIVIKNIEYNIDAMKGRVELTAFFENNVKEDRIKEIKDKVLKNSNVQSVEFTSSKEGLEQYKEDLEAEGDKEMMKILEESSSESQNPIPSSLTVKTKDSSKNSDVKKILISYDEIYKVNDGNLVTDFLDKISKFVKAAGITLLVILSVICVILISNTIKVAVLLRRKEIGIIKYIGATNNYIRLPFLSEGFIIGIIGAILSICTVSAIYVYAEPKILSSLNVLMDNFVLMNIKLLIPSISLITLLAGSIIGVIGSLVSIRKYMNV